MLHASPNYYRKGPWYDAIMAPHERQRAGGARRLPGERSAAERGDEAQVWFGGREAQQVVEYSRYSILLYLGLEYSTFVTMSGRWVCAGGFFDLEYSTNMPQ